MDNKAIREQFPILTRTMEDHPLVYLDNSATTLKPQCVIDEVIRYYTYLGANAHRGDYQMSAQVDEAFEHARDVAKDFIHAKHREEIVFTSGSSNGLNQIAQMVTHQMLQPGDIILSDESEHASSILPWMQAAKEKGCQIEFIALDDEGKITLDNVKRALHERVKVIALAQVSNVLGYQAPIKEICQLAHQQDRLVVVDGAQSAPHLDIDVQDMDCDFFVLSAHKLCGPTGVGIMYGKKALLDRLEPIFFGGESNARFNKGCDITLKHTPFKYESGTQPIEAALGMAAAMTFLQGLGKKAIHEHEVQLKEYFLEKAQSNPNIEVYNANSKSGICTFNVYDNGQLIPAQDIASFLSTRGIAVRSGQHCAKLLNDVLHVPYTVRASFYLYNTKEDVDALINALKEATLKNCVQIFF